MGTSRSTGGTFPLDRVAAVASSADRMKSSLILLAAAAVLLSACATQTESGNAALMKRFQQADASGDGKVSRGEFTDSMITEAFANYDKGGKGYVTLEEFTAGGGTPETFRRIDRDGNGRVTLVDAKASKVVRDQFVKPFDAADTSGTGYVTFEEFVAYRQAAAPYVR
jgi:Ca2+-binding EF-hand superfamily protein